MTEYKPGNAIQVIGNYGENNWQDAVYIGVDPINPDMYAVVLKDKLIWAPRDAVRRKARPSSICVMIYRNPNCLRPKDIFKTIFDTEGAARVYAFDRQLDVIKYITVEIPQ